MSRSSWRRAWVAGGLAGVALAVGLGAQVTPPSEPLDRSRSKAEAATREFLRNYKNICYTCLDKLSTAEAEKVIQDAQTSLKAMTEAKKTYFKDFGDSLEGSRSKLFPVTKDPPDKSALKVDLDKHSAQLDAEIRSKKAELNRLDQTVPDPVMRSILRGQLSQIVEQDTVAREKLNGVIDTLGDSSKTIHDLQAEAQAALDRAKKLVQDSSSDAEEFDKAAGNEIAQLSLKVAARPKVEDAPAKGPKPETGYVEDVQGTWVRRFAKKDPVYRNVGLKRVCEAYFPSSIALKIDSNGSGNLKAEFEVGQCKFSPVVAFDFHRIEWRDHKLTADWKSPSGAGLITVRRDGDKVFVSWTNNSPPEGTIGGMGVEQQLEWQ